MPFQTSLTVMFKLLLRRFFFGKFHLNSSSFYNTDLKLGSHFSGEGTGSGGGVSLFLVKIFVLPLFTKLKSVLFYSLVGIVRSNIYI